MRYQLLSAAALLCIVAAGPAQAETVACPDLRTLVQVGGCPTEDELQYTYIGYCSEDARAYRQETGVCVDYQDYRKLKNVSLWETKDGRFHAYVSCETPARAWRDARPAKVTVLPPSRSDRMARVTCDYASGVTLSYRTHAACQVEGEGRCEERGAACRANCE